MKAIHDLGGIHGFGPIKMDSAQFHERWEQEVFVINKIIEAITELKIMGTNQDLNDLNIIDLNHESEEIRSTLINP